MFYIFVGLLYYATELLDNFVVTELLDHFIVFANSSLVPFSVYIL